MYGCLQVLFWDLGCAIIATMGGNSVPRYSISTVLAH